MRACQGEVEREEGKKSKIVDPVKRGRGMHIMVVPMSLDMLVLIMIFTSRTNGCDCPDLHLKAHAYYHFARMVDRFSLSVALNFTFSKRVLHKSSPRDYENIFV
ncbi:hypothetical protein FNV43_RR02204 [Rhamnella rubrinervis]|uniref:Uncharacterized protein n=1 Tax=Rhamnella rubrinervis TaxID=2594499 RepID=A0A8K0HR20_9ROSA|nr:hypothetical protein FNV43_RR02204 [Rhamnella rubrinervis]